jgi:hypothetical protein
VWIADTRIAVASSASIDKARVQFDRGEMAFAMFDYDPSLEKIIEADAPPLERLRRLQKRVGKRPFPIISSNM